MPPIGGEGPEAPAYRFLTEDGGILVQYGPTLLSINATRYPGFPAYLEVVRWVGEQFASISPEASVNGYSLGFYNRISIKSVQDIKSLFRFHLNIDDSTMASEFVCQFSHRVPEGSLLTQIVTTPIPAVEESIKSLSVNNIVRHSFASSKPFDLEDWCRWLQPAHERAKAMFWDNLTPETQRAWDSTVNAAS